MKKKMRIQLFDNNLIQLSDRLVSQDPEFATGPKEKHDGPIKVEVTLLDNKDIEDFTTYLKRLSGSMPMRVVGKRGRKPAGSEKLDSTKAREEHYASIIETATTTDQKVLLEYMRELNYVLLTGEYIRLLGMNETIGITAKHEDRYCFMVRRIRKAKDPKNDKYDPYLVVGIDLLNPRKKVRVYQLGEESILVECKPHKKPINKGSTKEVLKFPKHLNEDERLKYSLEHRRLLDNPDLTPSKFYKRWESSVTVGIRL